MNDAIVIGGGPAGLAAAIALGAEGMSVTLVERRLPPVDKACGEGIMPEGAEILSRLGVDLPPGCTAAFRGLRFFDGEIAATALFRRGRGLGMERKVLHESLWRRAESLGVDLRWGRRATRFHDDGIETEDGRLRARWVVAADGERSAARAWLQGGVRAASRRFGIRRHYAVRAWSDLVEVHWSTGCEAYVTPVGPERICAAMLTDDASLRFDEALMRFPVLRKRLAEAPREGSEIGAATVIRKPRIVARGRYALLGDAAGSVDAITGEGVTLALRQAVSLACSLRGGGLEDYARSVRRMHRAPRLMSSMMLAIDRRERLRHGAMRLLSSSPRVFSSILDLHARSGGAGVACR